MSEGEKTKEKGTIPTWWADISHLNYPILLLNADGQILSANHSCVKILGYQSFDELSIIDITHEKYRSAEVKSYMDIFFGERSSVTVGKRLIRQDGSDIKVIQHTQSLSNRLNSDIALVSFDLIGSQTTNLAPELQQELIQKSANLLNLLDLSEFGSSYNKELIRQVRSNLQKLVN